MAIAPSWHTQHPAHAPRRTCANLLAVRLLVGILEEQEELPNRISYLRAAQNGALGWGFVALAQRGQRVGHARHAPGRPMRRLKEIHLVLYHKADQLPSSVDLSRSGHQPAVSACAAHILLNHSTARAPQPARGTILRSVRRGCRRMRCTAGASRGWVVLRTARWAARCTGFSLPSRPFYRTIPPSSYGVPFKVALGNAPPFEATGDAINNTS